MNWHLSTDPERPQNDEFCVIVVKRKNRYYVESNYMYWEADLYCDEEGRFVQNDEYCQKFKFSETIAWISEDEILNDFREFYKRKNKPASPPTQKQLDFIESICEEADEIHASQIM